MDNTPKNTSTEAGAELWELASRSCNDALRPEDLARLESLLAEDQQARHFYGFYMLMHAELAWRFRADGQTAIEGRGARDQRRGMAGSPAIDVSDGAAVEHPVVAAVELPQQLDLEPRTPNPEPPIPPIVLDLSSTTRSATPFVGSWAFSCMVSAAIMGVMLLGFWAYKITHYQHIAEAPSQSVPSDAMPEMVFVGRITGMVDVKWSDDPHYLPPLGFAHVPLDRKYILSSGLLEITYDSGAKVILEGPCTYEVESTAGGYLALGKLTAKVEKKRSEVRGQKSDHYPLSTTHYPLFSVRTPTAIITDLGTEFGVEVDKSGVTESHVFRGSVRVQVVGDSLPSPFGRRVGGEGSGREVILGENESARVERAEDRLVIVRGAASEKTARFVRAMPRPKPAVTVRIVETFDGVELGAAFEQMPPDRYAIRHGAAVYSPPLTDDGRPSRGYIRTVATDFCDRDFVFEATFQMHMDGPAHVPGSDTYIYFGLGDGVPNANYYNVVTCGLVLDFFVVDGRAFVRFCHPDSNLRGIGNAGRTVAEVAPPGSLGSGRHRFRMSKVGKWVRFAVDADFEGEFQPDFVSRPIHILAAGPPLLNATNSRLLVGAGYCDTITVRFEELSITYPKTPKQSGKGDEPMNGP